MADNSRLVYSSERGRICPGCSQPVAACCCHKPSPAPAGDGIVRVRRECKGRGGKTVTVISGLPLVGEELKTMAGDLKRRCGSGGTVKDGLIEIQGEHLALIVAELQQRGYTVKRAGG
ncbi:MAG: translation initiation factor SUI1 [Desulfuromonadales bacterium GWD2_61_12]|nr:MAG: translation initiation factor SUI1 [Desulfuromonadales bacterium GWC2_61_20]OGR32913.1 MAG: translation initiation factor SUI1 [Desulfuromonadales bacterium GWD2_61_12]HAD05184.1 stress response translation initiation inhibitor YciH [Desulfuromonas sp.]HBT84264.1 stress response translation initiation inhibitor YciH [Desulfuromonas sp.]